MTLGRKIVTGFAAMLSLVLILSAAALLSLRSISDDLDRAAKVTARKQYLAGNVNSAASEMASLARASVLAAVVGDTAGSAAHLQEFQAPQSRLAAAVAETRQLGASADGLAALDKLEQRAAVVRQGQENLRHAMANQQLDSALTIFNQHLQP